MQYVSNEYKESMNQLARNKSYMRVYLGLINQEAQTKAIVEPGNFTYFADLEKPIIGETVDKVYATCENDFSKVDGSMCFLPRPNSKAALYNGGIVTEDLCENGQQPEVIISFDTDDPLDIKGITIDFGDCYPSQLTIANDEGEMDYQNDSKIFRSEDPFNNSTYLKIKAVNMVNGSGRMRIHLITFGIGITIGNDKIISAELKSITSPIAESLPSVDFKLTIDNLDRYYDVDNDDSAINYMETGQKMEVYYGYTLDSGMIEWFKGNTVYMREWSSNNHRAEFGAADVFVYMQDEYKKGKYRPEGITLYDLAMDVLEDAGIEEYWIDPYLKTIVVYNPLPVVTHKECLQLIANAGRSVLSQNRDGIIMLKSSFRPESSISVNQTATYGDIKNVLKDVPYNEYSAFENNYMQVNGTQFFIPRGSDYIPAGYVSGEISDGNGLFAENPVITISMESAYTFYGITLLFGSIQPVEFTITTYNNGTKLKKYVVKSIRKCTTADFDFIDVDEFRIEFTKAHPYNRIHLNKIYMGEETDYRITYDMLKTAPNGTKLEKVKEMNVVRTLYTRGTELKDLTSDEVTLKAGEQEEYEFSLGNAVHDLQVEILVDDVIVDYGAIITESNTYCCMVKITNPPSSEQIATLKIKGYEYEISTISESIRLNNKGSIQTWNNPLISSKKDAENLVEWVGNYYKGENEYELSTRGDPRIDANDLIFLESKYVGDVSVRLEEVTTKFDGHLSGTLVGRREL